MDLNRLPLRADYVVKYHAPLNNQIRCKWFVGGFLNHLKNVSAYIYIDIDI